MTPRRYELIDSELLVIQLLLANNSCDLPRANDREVLNVYLTVIQSTV